MDRYDIIKNLYKLNNKYKKDGFRFVSLFGSYARGTEDMFSDIDITYKINHDLFFKDDAFAKLDKINDIKKELESIFHRKVDLIPANTKNEIIQTTLEKEQIAI